jgi:hypothetical protein
MDKAALRQMGQIKQLFDGSLKETARLQNLSYQTVRNQLDNIIEQIKAPENRE